MLSITGQLNSKEEALEFNRKVSMAKFNGGGCIATMACRGCYALITDSLCLCAMCITCPKCGYNHNDDIPKHKIVEYDLGLIATTGTALDKSLENYKFNLKLPEGFKLESYGP